MLDESLSSLDENICAKMVQIDLFNRLLLHIIFILLLPVQDSMSHVSILVSFPMQAFPPYRDIWFIVLFDVLLPTPHGTEHSDHSLYNDHTQSTAKERNINVLKGT